MVAQHQTALANINCTLRHVRSLTRLAEPNSGRTQSQNINSSKYFNSINKMQRLSGRRRGKLNLAVIQIQLKRCHLEEMSLFYFTKFDRFAVWATVIILDDLLLLSDNVCKIFSLQTLSWFDVGLCVQIKEEDRYIQFVWIIWSLYSCKCSLDANSKMR